MTALRDRVREALAHALATGYPVDELDAEIIAADLADWTPETEMAHYRFEDEPYDELVGVVKDWLYWRRTQLNDQD